MTSKVTSYQNAHNPWTYCGGWRAVSGGICGSSWYASL